ncbi:MAG TPA: pyrroline-5-carboxylate reductase [Gammaproteobacteria bacterium]|nr:pyrroline-5-carboxylate reductase [Gammaproteobacteria bacterium]
MSTTRPTIAVIGVGNMGSSLISGLINQRYPAEHLWASDPSEEKLQFLQKQFAISVTPDNEKAIQHAETIIFAVKPQILKNLALALAPLIQSKKPLIISIAAGIREKNLQKWLGGEIAIVRSMPNTPSLIGCGAAALYANGFTSPTQRKLAEAILRCVGLTVWLEDEKQLDAVTALSGSGPAYFFLMIEALQQAGQNLGLAEDTARLLALQTAYGAARLAIESQEDVVKLRQHVTSPGGTTEQALKILEKGKFRELIAQALDAAKKRSEELAES